MIYSIGYGGKSLGSLIGALKMYSVKELIDVRSRPFGSRHVFNRNNISKALEKEHIRYTWAGRYLGGFKDINEAEINNLAEYQQNTTVCIMCMEADHKECHRYYEIGKRLKNYGVDVIHL